jgi:glycerol-3-phosphate dehydrogenase
MSASYDLIIVGGGHNGLVTAANDDEIVRRGHDRLGEEGVS